MGYVPAEQRRSELVAAALRVLARDGVVGATTRRIADEAGVPVGTVHYCFGDKDELYAAVLEHLTAELLAVGERLAPDDADLAATLRRGLEALWPVVGGDRGLRSAALELTLTATRTPGLAQLARSQYAACLAALVAFLDAAARAHGLAVPAGELERLARWSAATVDGAVLALLVDGDEGAARAVLDGFVDVLVARLRASAPAASSGADGAAQARRARTRVPRPVRRADG